MAFLYTSVNPPAGHLAQPFGHFSESPFWAVENIIYSVYAVPSSFERLDLINGVRVFRTTEPFTKFLMKDAVGPFLQVNASKLYFSATDPSIGVAVVRDWQYVI